MKKFLALFFLLVLILQAESAFSRARTPTEFRSYSRQYTYDRENDGVIDRNYSTHKEKCDHNSECVVCIFPNAQALIGKQYTILTSGMIIIKTWDDFYLRGEVCKCHREYDNMYNFNSMEEARNFAAKRKREKGY